MFFDGKSGYFGDRTMEMYHIRRGFKKYRRGGGAQYSDWSMFCACMPLTQTALSMYREQILCFLMEKVDILGTALWRCTILEGVSKNIGGGGGAVL